MSKLKRMNRVQDEVEVIVQSKKQLICYSFIFVMLLITFFCLGYYYCYNHEVNGFRNNILSDLPRYCSDMGCLCYGGDFYGKEDESFVNFEIRT